MNRSGKNKSNGNHSQCGDQDERHLFPGDPDRYLGRNSSIDETAAEEDDDIFSGQKSRDVDLSLQDAQLSDQVKYWASSIKGDQQDGSLGERSDGPGDNQLGMDKSRALRLLDISKKESPASYEGSDVTILELERQYEERRQSLTDVSNTYISSESNSLYHKIQRLVVGMHNRIPKQIWSSGLGCLWKVS